VPALFSSPVALRTRFLLAVVVALLEAVVFSGSPRANAAPSTPLTVPTTLSPLAPPRHPGEGYWHPAGRRVHGQAAIYTTFLRPPANPGFIAGIAWMDTRLLRATLYSGSLSPGGFFWHYTAPIAPTDARTLVAAFSGGYLLKDSHGGYFSEGRLVAPLVLGAASLVIYRDGSVNLGAWGRDVGMSPRVVAVRQNLTLLVDHGVAAPGLNPADIEQWGSTLHGIIDTPRSALGITATGALIYVEGPMNIVDLAHLLIHAGAVRAMVLDMNPNWPVFATYTPRPNDAPATPSNGQDLSPLMYQTPARFFEPAYARDFITLSAR
jgi:Phosphodiester glycosidase